jgi:hypothetical protein
MSYIPQSGIWDTIKSIGSGAASIIKSQGTEEGKAAAYQDMAQQQLAAQQRARGGGMPSWVLPLGIGAGALVLFMALKKKG